MAFNRQQRRIIDQIPEHKIKQLNDVGEELEDFIDQLRDLKGIDLDVDEMLGKAETLRKQRAGILNLRRRG